MPISLLEQKGYEDIVVIRLLDDFLGKINLNKYQNINIKTFGYDDIFVKHGSVDEIEKENELDAESISKNI